MTHSDRVAALSRSARPAAGARGRLGKPEWIQRKWTLRFKHFSFHSRLLLLRHEGRSFLFGFVNTATKEPELLPGSL
ncbi:hypothetical protein CesoFtcFv8_021476 [Champsocephalus esox]|uniref:Uncharacterized protein n=1 Tax=Champsocephalus esox TaxID=159716 RepID=A0AAN8GMD9_9TELE|nr:hypothetical protein CesoFtcFv8_021476 [Champsocephalus esox]